MLLERIKKEISEFEKHMKAQGIDYVYNQAYYIAFMNELEYLFTEHLTPEELESDYTIFNELDGNICESIMDFYSQCHHQELYNPFFTESLLELIDEFIDVYLGD